MSQFNLTWLLKAYHIGQLTTPVVESAITRWDNMSQNRKMACMHIHHPNTFEYDAPYGFQMEKPIEMTLTNAIQVFQVLLPYTLISSKQADLITW